MIALGWRTMLELPGAGSDEESGGPAGGLAEPREPDGGEYGGLAGGEYGGLAGGENGGLAGGENCGLAGRESGGPDHGGTAGAGADRTGAGGAESGGAEVRGVTTSVGESRLTADAICVAGRGGGTGEHHIRCPSSG